MSAFQIEKNDPLSLKITKVLWEHCYNKEKNTVILDSAEVIKALSINVGMVLNGLSGKSTKVALDELRKRALKHKNTFENKMNVQVIVAGEATH